MRRWLLSVILAVVWMIPAAAQDIGEFVPERCPIPIPGDAVVDCGYLTVPERHENPNGPTIELAVAILRATVPDPRPDPVLYLEGGPGGSALWSLEGWIGYEIVRDRDLILLDQRGTGYSVPGLFCEFYEYPFNVDDVDFVEYETACAEAMRDDEIDLAAYNSAQTARDVKLLVSALGYEQVNLYGISYGTRVALTVLRDAPEVVRAAVLDSPYPPHIDGYADQAVNGFNSISGVLDACAADAACNTAFPELSARFFTWVESGEIVDIDYGDGEEEVDGYIVINDLFEILYDTAAIPYIPLALEQLIDGDGSLFADLFNGTFLDDPVDLDRYDAYFALGDDLAMVTESIDDYDDFVDYFNTLSDPERVELYDAALTEADYADYVEVVRLHLGLPTTGEAQAYLDAADNAAFNRLFDNIVSYLALGWDDVSSADGAFNSVTCVEELPFTDLKSAELSVLRYDETLRDGLMSAVYDQIDSCGVWDVPEAAGFEDELVMSDIPTLVLGGEFDPITPPVFVEATMEGLTRGQSAVIPGAGHSLIDSGDCPASLGVAFLNDPSAPLDMSCLADLRIEWVTE